MEELLDNFSRHVETNLNKDLAFRIKEYLKGLINCRNVNSDNYDEIEHEIKEMIASFLKNCNRDDFFEISRNLYNGFIDCDDKNIVDAVKYFVRIYSEKEKEKLKKIFYRWRINCLYKDSNNKKVVKNYQKPNITTIKNKEKIDIFDKLYQDAFKKQDEKLLNNEIKRISELEECTFRPVISKK